MIDDIYLQNIIQQAVEESEFREYVERELIARAKVESKSQAASEKSFVELPIIYEMDDVPETNGKHNSSSLKCMSCYEDAKCDIIFCDIIFYNAKASKARDLMPFLRPIYKN